MPYSSSSPPTLYRPCILTYIHLPMSLLPFCLYIYLSICHFVSTLSTSLPSSFLPPALPLSSLSLFPRAACVSVAELDRPPPPAPARKACLLLGGHVSCFCSLWAIDPSTSLPPSLPLSLSGADRVYFSVHCVYKALARFARRRQWLPRASPCVCVRGERAASGSRVRRRVCVCAGRKGSRVRRRVCVCGGVG